MITYHVYIVGTLRHHKIANLATVLRDRRWEPRCYGGSRALPIDITAFWSPRLENYPPQTLRSSYWQSFASYHVPVELVYAVCPYIVSDPRVWLLLDTSLVYSLALSVWSCLMVNVCCVMMFPLPCAIRGSLVQYGQ